MNEILEGNETIDRVISYTDKRRKIGVAYALWFFFGIIGAHRMYISIEDDDIRCLIQIFGTVFGIGFLLFLPSVGFFLLLTAYILAIWDVFLIPSLVRKRNLQLMKEFGINPRDI